MPAPRRPRLRAPARTTARLLALAIAAALAGPRALAQPAAPQPAGPQPAGPPAPVGLAGTVYDSLARAPLAGATVQLVRADNAASARTTTADSAGAFRFDSLAPGRYLLGFFDPVLDALSLQANPVVVVADGRALPVIALAIPGPQTIRAAVCPATTPADSTGAVAGVVRDAASGDAVSGATVVLSWEEVGVSQNGLQRETRRIPTTVRADGAFLVCGVPTDVAIAASATAPGATSGLVELTPPPRGLLVQRFTLGPVAPATAGAATDSADAAARGGLPRPAPGTARLEGRVVGADARPLANAQVRVWGTDARAVTDAAGRYALAGLPAGTYTVEARSIGLEPARQPVDLAGGRAATVQLALAKPAVRLERVAVVGKPGARASLLAGFDRRRQTGQGRYFTAEDIQKRRAFEVTDVIRGVATLNVVPRGARGNVLRGRRNCVPTVWLDGNLITNGANEIDDLVPATGVTAIEVYGGGAALPPEFNATGTGGSLSGSATCGAVVIWTNR